MGFWKEISGEFKKKTKKAIKLTPSERNYKPRLKKMHENVSKYGKSIDFRKAYGSNVNKKFKKPKRQIKPYKIRKKGKNIIIRI